MSLDILATEPKRTSPAFTRRLLSFAVVMIGLMANAAWIAFLFWLAYEVVVDQI